MDKAELIVFREMAKNDLNFIYTSWLRGFRFGNDWIKEIDSDTYYEEYQKVIDGLLKKASVLVACLKDDPDVILGYSVKRDDVIDWVFVKKAWRKFGLGNKLIGNVKFCTHLTYIGNAIRKKKSITFNPFR